MIGQAVKISLLLSLMTLSACGVYEHKPIFMRFGADHVSSEHSPEFQQGWNDGCKTGSATYGNHFTKAFTDYTRDPNMVGNHAYESAWTDSYHWCRQQHNTNINAWDSDWGGFLTLQ
jgi:hypothetical protein